jgi:hypothetical protein
MYSHGFLEALGAWQRGWQEAPERRLVLARALDAEVGQLPDRVKVVEEPCFRKRFLYDRDLGPLFLGGLDEGPTSWTLRREYAHRFKGYYRAESVCAAIFAHSPSPEEVVVNIVRLWEDPDFREALSGYQARGGPNADALENFKGDQGEVVLRSKLKAIDIIGLTGIGSPLDALFDQIGVIEAARQPLAHALMDAGMYVGEPTWIWDDHARALVDEVYDRFIAVLESLRNRHGAT